MRTLSEVFAPGAPTLPEGLRTLVVSPDRELEPGMTVRATFTFRNQGGAAATGVRVRFNLPDGLVYLVGTGQLDGTDLDDELGNSPLISRSGAHIGDVAPGEERRIEISYSVAGAIENGTTIELQAAVASFELPPVGSNVVRLIARSRPQLANALTRHHHRSPLRTPVPGSEAQITVRMHNAGESSAHDVVVVAPIPEHTSYVAGSARVNGREIERDLGVAFDRMYAPIVAPALPASASATLVYRVRIDAPLPDGTRDRRVRRRSRRKRRPPSRSSRPRWSSASTPISATTARTFTVEPSHDVRPGQRVALVACGVQRRNRGRRERDRDARTARDADSGARAPPSIDGRAVRERRKETLALRSRPHRRRRAGRAAHRSGRRVAAARRLPLSTSPRRSLGNPPATTPSRRFERTVAVRSEPSLPQRRNALVARGRRSRAAPATKSKPTILLANDGSAAASDVVLHLRVDPALDDVRAVRKDARVAIDGDTIDLGTLEAYAPRQLVAARARALAVCRPQRSARRRERAYARTR